ncbi:F1F0 ATP synthase subunit e, mitochondrial [Vermiconidia calcicola]|uniref:F1F0 ATP synthase subunit e, mitochondrial n=1 Tax=Vermiconidia calcicola TaxID=1690605 RepID=A0ACC3MFX6_9PEZI|nr:F1F0 ATP synthase subunit e, mitochondrial [Vermiconidia calcicola]
MASTGTGVNVLRWGALVFGIFYGFSHQSTLRSQDQKRAAQHQWDRKEKLIQEAKAAYAQKNASRGSGDDGGMFAAGVVGRA